MPQRGRAGQLPKMPELSGDADGRAPVGEPVAVGAAAVAAPAEDVHDVVALLQRVVAAQHTRLASHMRS
jgi:hypothetical protein